MGRSTQLDKILVVDLECTCWRDKPPLGQRSEIIEIGVCEVNLETLEVGEAESMMVRPTWSCVSGFCTELTSITADDVENAPVLVEALSVFSAIYSPYKRVWASYGDFDREHLQKECREKAMHYPFGKTHINIKNLLAVTRGWEREVGMKKALEILGIPLEGRHHRGVDDARNIAKILVEILKGWKR